VKWALVQLECMWFGALKLPSALFTLNIVGAGDPAVGPPVSSGGDGCALTADVHPHMTAGQCCIGDYLVHSFLLTLRPHTGGPSGSLKARCTPMWCPSP
jgi:hypothetical protein